MKKGLSEAYLNQKCLDAVIRLVDMRRYHVRLGGSLHGPHVPVEEEPVSSPVECCMHLLQDYFGVDWIWDSSDDNSPHFVQVCWGSSKTTTQLIRVEGISGYGWARITVMVPGICDNDITKSVDTERKHFKIDQHKKMEYTLLSLDSKRKCTTISLYMEIEDRPLLLLLVKKMASIVKATRDPIQVFRRLENEMRGLCDPFFNDRIWDWLGSDEKSKHFMQVSLGASQSLRVEPNYFNPSLVKIFVTVPGDKENGILERCNTHQKKFKIYSDEGLEFEVKYEILSQSTEEKSTKIFISVYHDSANDSKMNPTFRSLIKNLADIVSNASILRPIFVDAIKESKLRDKILFENKTDIGAGVLPSAGVFVYLMAKGYTRKGEFGILGAVFKNDAEKRLRSSCDETEKTLAVYAYGETRCFYYESIEDKGDHVEILFRFDVRDEEYFGELAILVRSLADLAATSIEAHEPKKRVKGY